MRKRVCLLIGVLALLIIAGILFFWPRNRITQANLERIREGMTKEEVIAILGPPGNYETVTREWAGARAVRFPGKQENWYTDDLGVFVSFDNNGKVLEKASVPYITTHLSFFERIRRWLGLGP